MSPDYNLKRIFAVTAGNYLSDVEVQIRDTRGREVLETTSQGPWLFTKLPAGTYHVQVNTLVRSLKQVAQVPSAGQARLSFSF